MIPDDMLPHLVDVETPGVRVDRYDNKVDDWSASTHTTVQARMQQQTSSEDNDQRSAQLGEWLLVCNPVDVNGSPLTIDSRARIHWAGADFEVAGPTAPVHELADVHHFEIALTFVKG
ncbi:hypothetical protein ABZ656_33915 [Streptomyces sp. NPDC007095]|uniref:hypothetical protein n=1 Tax=Streptomyces sp. NPDC007095 TaxID=3154482 RepID=UPI0033F17E3F